MKKCFFTTVLVGLLLSSLVISVFADSIHATSSKSETGEVEIENSRILMLERALEPKEPYAAAKAWAEGVRTRNGALQYAVMSQNLKEVYYPIFTGLGWVTGVSSPWVENYEVTEKYRLDNDKVVFTYSDSTKSTFSTEEYITVNHFNGSWLVSAIERVDIAGVTTNWTNGDDEQSERFYVESLSDGRGQYDKANVLIGSETRIYEGYTDNELSISDLKEGTKVLVTFTDDPRIMIYPVSATARIIRVVEDEVFPKSFELKVENIELKDIPTINDLSTMEKLEDRQLGRVNGQELVLSLYSDDNKVCGVFEYGNRQFILSDLGYSHDVESIKVYDLQIGYENDGNMTSLLVAAGSDISGYKYVFYDQEHDQWRYYHNWGIPVVTDVNGDETKEVLMQFEGLHNNAPNGFILTFSKGQFMVSEINSAIYEQTGLNKGVTIVSSTFIQQDNKTMVVIERFGDKRMKQSYCFNDGSLTSLKEAFEEIDSIIYENTQYGFRFMLPQSWGNFTVLTEDWEGLSMGEQVEGVIETGPVIHLRHPLWTAQNPRQDIPIMIFTMEQWDGLNKAEFHIGAAPVGPKELSRNSQFVFALPARYNYALLTGFEEVERILDNDPIKPIGKMEPETVEEHTQVLNVYYTCTEQAPGGLYPVDRIVPEKVDAIQAALEEMLKGPSEEEKKLGFRSHFSEQTAGMLKSVERIKDGKTIIINFADFRNRIDRSTVPSSVSFGPGGIMADITWTIFKQFPDVDALRFSFEGDESAFWSWLTGQQHAPKVFTRTDWEQV